MRHFFVFLYNHKMASKLDEVAYDMILKILNSPPTERGIFDLIKLIPEASILYYNSRELPANTINYMYILHPFINRYFHLMNITKKADFITTVNERFMPLILRNKWLRYMYRSFHYQFYCYPKELRRQLFDRNIVHLGAYHQEDSPFDKLCFNIMIRNQLIKLTKGYNDVLPSHHTLLVDILSSRFLKLLNVEGTPKGGSPDEKHCDEGFIDIECDKMEHRVEHQEMEHQEMEHHMEHQEMEFTEEFLEDWIDAYGTIPGSDNE